MELCSVDKGLFGNQYLFEYIQNYRLHQIFFKIESFLLDLFMFFQL